ncbi:5-oxoprolinase subunit B family protein [Limnobacter sp.]|uniref:5-oxoprolinase subunit B family protein n=1 Tax=Limnobacter sp. TaxID=2003368 RepID=UPI002FE3B4D4
MASKPPDWHQPAVYGLSDRAIQIDWSRSSIEIARLSTLLSDRLLAAGWPAFRCVQADESLTLLFAQVVKPPHCVQTMLTELPPLLGKLSKQIGKQLATGRHHSIVVNYGGVAGQDLDWLAAQTGLCTDDVIELHSNSIYTVQFLGFLPGFAYLTGLPEKLQFSRRNSPRARVPAGTLAIGAHYCSVYPWESPGGWHLLGHVEHVLFDPEAPDDAGHSLLQVGDTVQFVRVEHA